MNKNYYKKYIKYKIKYLNKKKILEGGVFLDETEFSRINEDKIKKNKFNFDVSKNNIEVPIYDKVYTPDTIKNRIYKYLISSSEQFLNLSDHKPVIDSENKYLSWNVLHQSSFQEGIGFNIPPDNNLIVVTEKGQKINLLEYRSNLIIDYLISIIDNFNFIALQECEYVIFKKLNNIEKIKSEFEITYSPSNIIKYKDNDISIPSSFGNCILVRKKKDQIYSSDFGIYSDEKSVDIIDKFSGIKFNYVIEEDSGSGTKIIYASCHLQKKDIKYFPDDFNKIIDIIRPNEIVLAGDFNTLASDFNFKTSIEDINLKYLTSVTSQGIDHIVKYKLIDIPFEKEEGGRILLLGKVINFKGRNPNKERNNCLVKIVSPNFEREIFQVYCSIGTNYHNNGIKRIFNDIRIGDFVYITKIKNKKGEYIHVIADTI